jgi:ABC-type polysaccharide/polyol phosphate export permease
MKQRVLTAIQDLAKGIAMYELWWTTSYNEIRLRYRRSMIGPFWLTLNMLILIGTLGILYSTLFKQDLRTYIPFVSTGFLVWGLISAIITDSCNTFINSANIIKNTNLPFTLFAFRDISKNAFIFLHNASILIPMYLFWPEYLNLKTLLVIPALGLVLVNGIWVTLLLGIVCARYRDVPLIVTNLLQIAMFLTPIFWPPSAVGPHVYVLGLNPLYHALTLVRSPLLGQSPPISSWVAILAITIAGSMLTLVVFGRYRSRIAFAL